MTIHSLAFGSLMSPVLYITASLAHTPAGSDMSPSDEIQEVPSEGVLSAEARDPPDLPKVPSTRRTTSRSDEGVETEDFANRGNSLSFY